MVVVSFFLGLCVAGFAGFVIGRKTQLKDQGEAMAMTAEIAPSIQSEEKLDAAFSDLRLGNAKKALLGFQDVQSLQPGLYGIDFLVGYAAHFAGEPALARESFQTAIGKKELEEEATAIISLDDVTKQDSGAGAPAIADPVATAETALRHYASRRPLDPRAYYLCAEMLRSKGSYRTAGELMAKALGRTDPRFDPRLIEAKMVLSRLQNEPPKEAVSISSVTSLDGAGALSAAYAALVNKKSDEGVLFLERASEFYPGTLFTELMQDQAFDEFRTDSKFGEFLKKH
jgi:tetratricopeptide (TPR) repeat protein